MEETPERQEEGERLREVHRVGGGDEADYYIGPDLGELPGLALRGGEEMVVLGIVEDVFCVGGGDAGVCFL